MCYIFKPFRAWQVHEQLEEKMALLREEVMLSWGYFFVPPKLDSVKKIWEKPILKMDGFWEIYPLFSKNIHIHYVFVVYFGS